MILIISMQNRKKWKGFILSKSKSNFLWCQTYKVDESTLEGPAKLSAEDDPEVLLPKRLFIEFDVEARFNIDKALLESEFDKDDGCAVVTRFGIQVSDDDKLDMSWFIVSCPRIGVCSETGGSDCSRISSLTVTSSGTFSRWECLCSCCWFGSCCDCSSVFWSWKPLFAMVMLIFL